MPSYFGINPNTQQKLLVLVEDDNDIADFLVEVLTEEDSYGLILATTGQEALSICSQQRPDLIILNYRLPDMTGLTIYDRVQTLYTQPVPVLMISANMPLEVIKDRTITFLPKPFDMDRLLLIVQKLIKQFPAQEKCN